MTDAQLASAAPTGLVSKLSDTVKDALRAHCTARLESMRSYRMSFWAHWAACAEMLLPRRYRWFVTPNQWNRGSPMNQAIVDETGMLAARVLATGLLSGLTSPTKPWFSLGIAGQDDATEGPVQAWLAECTSRMLTVYAGSNFYQALGTNYLDLVVFGSSPLIQYEDADTVIHFYTPCLGEFMFGLNAKLEVDSLFREYTYTIKEAVDAFGLANMSIGTQQSYKTPSNLDTEIVICHAIEPNGTVYQGGVPVDRVLPAKYAYREVFWEQTSAGGQKGGFLIKVAGFNEKPFAAFRWDVTSNDAYGRSPGMDALPCTRQLQIEQRRKAEAIDKMVRPPMVASVSMKNEPMDILPGGVSYVADPTGSGFKPAFTVEPRIAEMMEDIKEVQARNRTIFFNDLFLGISQLGTVRTATEIEARQQETLVQIGPVIERTQTELDQIVERTFAIMARRKLFPPAPAEIQGRALVVKYVSLFAETQRAASTTAIERLMAFVGGLAALQPDIMDNIDTDEVVEKYASELNVSPDVIRDLKQIAAIRANREQAQQTQAALQVGTAAAQGAQTLSQTDVGGGQNALQAMIGKSA